MDQIYRQIIANRILTMCQSRGISINKLAGMSGVGQSTLDSLVNGQTSNPTIKTLHKIAIAFNMTLSEFTDYPELNEYSFDDNEQEDG